MNFEDVRNMSNEELAKWLSKIWKTGFLTCQLGGSISEDKPDFYEKLSEVV